MEFRCYGDFEVSNFKNYLNEDGLYVFSFNGEIIKLTEDELRDELCEILLISHNYDRLLTCSLTREDKLIKAAILEVILKANDSVAKKKEKEIKKHSKNKKKMIKKSKKKGRK